MGEERYYKIKVKGKNIGYFDSKKKQVLNIFEPKINLIQVSNLEEEVEELFKQYNQSRSY